MIEKLTSKDAVFDLILDEPGEKPGITVWRVACNPSAMVEPIKHEYPLRLMAGVDMRRSPR